MEEYLLHRCVTSSVDSSGDSASTWQISGRAECVLVQENRHAHGVSRVILSAMLKLVVQSFKTTNVLLLTLDTPEVAQCVNSSVKLTQIDYSADATTFQPSTSSESHLLARILQDVKSVEETVEVTRGMASRPMVVVLDSLNALLQQASLQQVLLFLRQLRTRAVIGSVIMRLNAGAESSEAARALAAQATALVLVETRSSLRSYPLLSQDQRREIPKDMHGLALLVRQKTNGRSSESIEYFQVLSNQVRFVATTDIKSHEVSNNPASKNKNVITKAVSITTNSKGDSQIIEKLSNLSTMDYSGNVPLPVRQEDVSFNLSISAAEQQAKNQVELPYMHQGSGQRNSSNGIISESGKFTGGNNTLFFIDDDDPDWDDDDLDDDLDI